MLRIICSREGKEGVFEFQDDTTEISIGRRRGRELPDVDLEADVLVSRRHARLTRKGEVLWLEDLGSFNGTQVNGSSLEPANPTPVHLGDVIAIGETTLQLEQVEEAAPDPAIVIGDVRDASVIIAGDNTVVPSRRAQFYELPWEFGAARDTDRLLEIVVERVVAVVPKVARAALVLCEPTSGALRAQPHHVPGKAVVSGTLARRAIQEGQGFIWDRVETDVSVLLENHTGMYAPMMWQGTTLGVICADSTDARVRFGATDLQIFVGIAQYAAMALANLQLQESLQQAATIRENLLRQFSPKVAEKLLAHRGRLTLGGERSNVSVLCSDIRGFTRLAASLSPEAVVDMLNDYFAHLIPIIFDHAGTVDKYVGDSILAVFGSPEPNPDHHLDAVRAAIAMQAAVADLNQARMAQGEPFCEMGIGIHCGEVIHGFIGAEQRMEFTVIGDTVNLASRYCDGAQGGEVLISPELYDKVRASVLTEAIALKLKHGLELAAERIRGLRGNGRLTLSSRPEGAACWLHEIRNVGTTPVSDPGRFIGTTPLDSVALPMGGYHITLRLGGCREIAYPVVLDRDATWRGTVNLYADEVIGPDFVYVPAGLFHFGGDNTVALGAAPRAVLVLEDFFIAKHPVTLAEYVEFLDDIAVRNVKEARRRAPRASAAATSYLRFADGHFQLENAIGGDDSPLDPRWPVVGVSWHDAVDYCAWRTRRESRPYRLPTEHEWEKAARGVGGRVYPWGDGFSAPLANLRESRRSGQAVLARVDEFPGDVSPYGVRGLAGNVRDWTSTEIKNVRPEVASARVVRGGAWYDQEHGARCANRSWLAPTRVMAAVGFRLAHSPLVVDE